MNHVLIYLADYQVLRINAEPWSSIFISVARSSEGFGSGEQGCLPSNALPCFYFSQNTIFDYRVSRARNDQPEGISG